MGSHNNSQTNKANSVSDQDRQAQQQAVANVNQTTSQFGGPVNQSPYYRALLAAGTNATNNAFNWSQSALRRNANAAGFGYSQPATQGASTELEGEHDAALSQVPGQALTAATNDRR